MLEKTSFPGLRRYIFIALVFRHETGEGGTLSRGKEQSLAVSRSRNSRDLAVSWAVPRHVHRTIIILIRKWREPNASAVIVGRDRGRTLATSGTGFHR